MYNAPSLELLADAADSLAASQREIRDRSLLFRKHFIESHIDLRWNRDISPLFTQLEMPHAIGNPFGDHPKADHYFRLLNTFRDLENGRFWGVIHQIDGSAPRQGISLLVRSPRDLQKDAYDHQKAAQQWAGETFSEDEIQELFTLVVNQALLRPYKSNWPGTNKGHSILLRELVDKPFSLFEHAVDENFLQRLVNGTFWEELPDMKAAINSGISYHRVDRVLTDFAYLLDEEFAPKGIGLFRRNAHGHYNFNLDGLSRQAVDAYAGFVQKIDARKEELTISSDDLDQLVKPYALEVIGWDSDWDQQTIYPADQPRGIDKRFREEWIQPYVAEEGFVRSELAEQMSNYAEWEESMYHAALLLPHIPNPKDFLGAMLARMHPVKVGMFAAENQQIVDPLLTETSRVLYQQGEEAYAEQVRLFREADQPA